MGSNERNGGTAVWYFVGAVFLFVAPMLFFPSIARWVRILLIALGVVVMVAGFVQLRRELNNR